MASTSGLILDQVVALIEPLTRFDRSAVRLHAESEKTLRCTGNWTSSIAISSSVSDGIGKLPAGVRDAGSQSGMERAINETISDEHSNVARRVQGWCDRQAQLVPSAHTALTANDCISGVTRIGYAWKCSSCKGQGKTTCSTCRGGRTVTCSQCNGMGRVACSQCQGRGTRSCSSCGGQGGRFKQVPISYYNSATNQNSVRYESKWEGCMAAGCHSGQVTCFCAGGKVNCGRCLASGKVTCISCNGKGEQTCSACNGTAMLHRVAETHCQVSNSFAIHSQDFGEEDQETSAGWDFQTFCHLASVSSEAPAITASQLRRAYPATLSRTQARVECAGQDLLLSGYGTKARVFNFKGIVGHLLAKDLDQLRSTLTRPWGFLPFRNHGALRTALASMLQSELNQQLASPQQRAALVANRTVTEEHAATTARCLRQAMSRLYGSVAMVALAILFIVAYFTLYRLLWTGYMLPQNRLMAAAIFVAVVATAAIAAEALSRYFFLRGFSSAGNGRRQAAHRLLRGAGTLRRWRIAAAATIVVALISFFVVTL